MTLSLDAHNGSPACRAFAPGRIPMRCVPRGTSPCREPVVSSRKRASQTELRSSRATNVSSFAGVAGGKTKNIIGGVHISDRETHCVERNVNFTALSAPVLTLMFWVSSPNVSCQAAMV